MISESQKRLLASATEKFRAGSFSLSFQLGLYVGEYIIDRYLPSISCGGIKTRNQISVTCAEGDEVRRLEKIWFETSQKDEELYNSRFNDFLSCIRSLEDKYLPEILECDVLCLDISDGDLNDFKEGLISTLWDCDMCSYDLTPENVVVMKDTIILKRKRYDV